MTDSVWGLKKLLVVILKVWTVVIIAVNKIDTRKNIMWISIFNGPKNHFTKINSTLLIQTNIFHTERWLWGVICTGTIMFIYKVLIITKYKSTSALWTISAVFHFFSNNTYVRQFCLVVILLCTHLHVASIVIITYSARHTNAIIVALQHGNEYC